MLNRIVPLTAMVCLLLGSVGCETSQQTPYPMMDLADPARILHTVIGGHPSLNQPGLRLINSQAQLDALGVEGLLGRDVNFYNESVILVTLGEMPTAGYWINITAVQQVGRSLYVLGQANRPADDAVLSQMLTYPYCAVIIPRTTATNLRDAIDSVEGEDPPA